MQDFLIFRRYDGISNNKQHVLWGAGGQNLRRTTLPAYSDGIASPASTCYDEQRRNQSCAYSQEYSGYGSTRPSPRDISNLLFRQTGAIISARRINDFHVHFGQVSKTISNQRKDIFKIRCGVITCSLPINSDDDNNNNIRSALTPEQFCSVLHNIR